MSNPIDTMARLRREQLEAESELANAQVVFNDLVRQLLASKSEIDKASERVRHLGVQVRAEYDAYLNNGDRNEATVETKQQP